MERKILNTAMFGLLVVIQAFAQDNKPSLTQFMIRGYGHTGINYQEVEGEKESTYVGTAFAPIFLFKHSDKMMAEVELEFELENNKVNVGFEYANFSYVLNKFVIFRAGKFLLPFGTFMERLHPAWINKLSTRPLGFGHDGIAPSSGIGLELRGTMPIGGSKINYSVYTTNGATLKDGSIEPEEAGMLSFNNFEDNNKNKAFGGRIGFLPFSNSSIEIGLSFYTGGVGNQDDSLYGNINAALYAADFSFVKQIAPLKGIIDVKAQYSTSLVNQATYFELEPGDTIPTPYSFNNFSQSWYAQLSYRPSMLGNKILKNFEIVARYSSLNMPEGSEWEQQSSQISVGLNYWISWRNVLKLSYNTTSSEGGHDVAPGASVTRNGIYVHWALGF